MRWFVSLLLSIIISLTAFAQQPDWYENDQRAFNYPVKLYFVGFTEGQKRSSERLETTMLRMKDAARVEAVSSIRVHVQNSTNINGFSRTLESMEESLYQSIEEFSSRTTINVDVEIPGLQVESWQNPQTGTIAAFAYVKKSSLIRQLEKKITVGLTKIETSIEQVDELVASGQKMKARELAEKSLPLFDEVKETQLLLAAVDEDADAESLQLDQTRTLQKRLGAQVAQLKHGINIYLSCKADMFGQPYSTMASEIKGELSKMGCTFVTKPADADWAIYVNGTVRQHPGYKPGDVTYFVYNGATITIDKVVAGQRIYENSLPEEKGGHTQSFVEAARSGYKRITPNVISVIKENIQQ